MALPSLPSSVLGAVQTTPMQSFLAEAGTGYKSRKLTEMEVNAREQVADSDFHGGEVHTHVPKWEDGSPCDLVMKQLVVH